jgi:hypothetical protein
MFKKIDYGLIQGVVASAIGLFVFFWLITKSELFAAVIWLINVFLLSWFWWRIESDGILDWVIGGSLFILVSGVLFLPFSFIVVGYYLILLVLFFLVFLGEALENLFQKQLG